MKTTNHHDITLHRSLACETRILSEADGLVEYIASDESLDSYNEIISAKGWRFSRFAKNAPFVDSHDYFSIDKLLGEVVAARVEGRALIERVRWAKDVEEHNLARLGWKMTLGGFLKAVSVGFFPTKWARNGGEGFAEASASIGLKPEDAKNVRAIYLEQEQIELSACIIGANPNALAKSFAEGCIKDADLAAVGFADDDMEFLKLVGPILDKEDTPQLERLLIGREIARITERKNLSRNGQKQSTSTSPGTPDGGGDAERRAAERRTFLERLAKF
jgi:hypothetical protein